MELSKRNQNRKIKTLKRNRLPLLSTWAVATILMACSGQTRFYSFQSLPEEGWRKTDTLEFRAHLRDSFTTCQLRVEVRNRNNYLYQNLALQVEALAPDSSTIFSKPIDIKIAAADGGWQGTGIGDLHLTTTPGGEFRLKQAGEYRFRVVHTLPDTLLIGVEDVGLHLMKKEK